MKVRKKRILETGLSISGAGQNQTMTECHTTGRQGCRLACVFLGFSITRVRSTTMFKVLYKALISLECIKKFMLFPVELRNMFQNIRPGQYVSSPRASEASRWDLPLEWVGNGTSYLPAVQRGKKGFRPQLLETRAPCWPVTTWVSCYGWGCV